MVSGNVLRTEKRNSCQKHLKMLWISLTDIKNGLHFLLPQRLGQLIFQGLQVIHTLKYLILHLLQQYKLRKTEIWVKLKTKRKTALSYYDILNGTNWQNITGTSTIFKTFSSVLNTAQQHFCSLCGDLRKNVIAQCTFIHLEIPFYSCLNPIHSSHEISHCAGCVSVQPWI